jgi:hypothetical protein
VRGSDVGIIDGMDRVRWHDIYTKFHSDWYWHSKMNRGWTHDRYTLRKVISLRLLLFLQNKESSRTICIRIFMQEIQYI